MKQPSLGEDTKIALMVNRFPQVSETFIVNKFVGLVDRGRDIHVVCRAIDREAWESFAPLSARPDLRSRIHACHFPPRGLRDFARLAAQLVACALMHPKATFGYLRRARSKGWRRAARDLCIDAPVLMLEPHIVHFEFGTLAAERAYLKERIGCTCTVSFRGYDLNYVGLDEGGYYDEVWEKVDAVHCLGKDLWERALKRGCPSELAHVLIPPAIDATRYQPPRRNDPDRANDGVVRLLSVGRLHWKKGYEFALAAVRQAVDRGADIDYRIVGDGPYLEAIAFARHQLGLTERVHLLGAFPVKQVIEEMRGTDIFIHAAVSEGFSNAVMEAQAMQLPVVCTDADGLGENLAQGVTGFVVPRRDPGSMASRIVQLAGDPGLRESMGAAGRKRVLERFVLEDQIDAFERFFGDVMARAVR